MGQLVIWVWKPPLPALFATQLFQRKYLGSNLSAVSLSLHIWGRVDKIHKTAYLTMLSLYFFPSDLQSFWNELKRSSKTAHAYIWTHKDWKHIFGCFKSLFTNKKIEFGRKMSKSSDILFTMLYVLLWISISFWINLFCDTKCNIWSGKILFGKCCSLKANYIVYYTCASMCVKYTC